MTKINNIMHQETPYKTIQRTKYIVQVVVCKLAAMSEKNSVCIFCNEGSTSSKRLTNNPDMIYKLVDCCNELLYLGQSYIKQLSDCFANLSESERKCVRYHSECRKHIVNMSMMHGSGVSESGQIQLYVLHDRLGVPSTRLTLHFLRGQNLPQKPGCVYSHNVASVQMALQDLFTVLSLTG